MRLISLRDARAFAARAALLAIAGLLCSPAAFAQSPRVIPETHHDVSLPLADLARMTPAEPHPFSPRVLRILPTAPAPERPDYNLPDIALQQTPLPPVSAVLGLNFDGLGLGEYGFLLETAPPDTNGAVGATQYVQWVNTDFAVFDKATGALIAAPTPGKSLWAGFGGVCSKNNDGDPIVQYDKLAGRWVLSQFSISTLPYTECVAVSTTSDATGTYNRYAFSFGDTDYPDYPKLGVWPDAYYMSFNLFDNSVFLGADACALDRNAMLAGTAAQIICFPQSSTVASLLPSDMDGTILPADGEPAFFMNFGQNVLQLWSFHVDFATPANSTFIGPTVLPVSSFTPRCLRGCVAQPGTTQKLDAIGDRLMYRLAYRRFSDGTESLVLNHSISAGVRWYEVRSPNATPAVYQQGTFHPNSSIRWMGSIAMDQSADIALGYSVSSTSVFPSVYFTGRQATDPLGSMEGEQLIVSGLGSQTGGLSRWGDYSSMTIDPADDCTFWYTQEYILSNGNLNWNTRIANFKFPNCGVIGIPAVSLNPASLAWGKVVVGKTGATKQVTVTNTGNGTLAISNIAASGDFVLQTVPPKSACGSLLAAGASCIVKVAFAPTQTGLRTGSLTISDNAPDSPQTVPLSGTGK